MKLSFNNSSSNIPSVSSPTTDSIKTCEPNALQLRATFPAPPIRYSFLSNETIGTGASGEMRSTFPHMYVSSMRSPITPTRSVENDSNSFWKSSMQQKSEDLLNQKSPP